MANTINNNITTASIIRPQGAQEPTLSFLPTRWEKLFVASPVANPTAASQIASGFAKNAAPTPASASSTSITNAYQISLALEPLTDFVLVYVQNRGMDGQGNSDATASAVFRFLINPRTIGVAHSTLESESFARSGWLFGIWGEDMVRITLSGKTPGRYFTLGLTDAYAEYSESYQNLEQLQIVFENNGYWFEGETSGLPPNLTRRQIKMHQDVVLAVKEFIWYGMFETLEVTQDANNPFLADYSLTFLAWKERFRDDSPYYDAIINNVERGHAYSAFQAQSGQSSPTVTPAPQTGPSSGQPQNAVLSPGGSTTATSPAAQAEQNSSSLFTVSPLAATSTVTQPVLNNDLPAWADFWGGVQN